MNGQISHPSPSHYDVLVIGGGIIGFTTAMAIRQQGGSVALVDAGRFGLESSWAGAGILSPLLPWQYGCEVNDLCRLGAQRHGPLAAQLLQETGIDPEYLRCGMTVLPPHGGGPTPAQSHAPIHLPEVAQVRNPRLLQALARFLSMNGVVLLENTGVAGWHTSSGRPCGVKTPGGMIGADQFVVCAGAWTPKILGELGTGLDIRPIRGQMLLFKGKPGALDAILYRDGTYLVPRRDGHILVGSTLEDTGFDKATTPEARERLNRNALEMFPALRDMALVQQWAGLRPGTRDNIPVIARHPEIDNLWVNAGHFRYGVTMAPASAEILVALMTGNTPPLPAESYAWPMEAQT